MATQIYSISFSHFSEKALKQYNTYAYGNVDTSELPGDGRWSTLDLDIERMEKQRKELYKEPLYRIIETAEGFKPCPIEDLLIGGG